MQGNERGYTLVELIVAAVIMVLVLSSLISLIRTGSEIEITDNYRRVAKSNITSWFEENFQPIAFDTISRPDTFTATDTLANIEGNPIIGNRTVIVVPDTITVSSYGVPALKATASVVWTDFDGTSDSISMERIITKSESNGL